MLGINGNPHVVGLLEAFRARVRAEACGPFITIAIVDLLCYGYPLLYSGKHVFIDRIGVGVHIGFVSSSKQNKERVCLRGMTKIVKIRPYNKNTALRYFTFSCGSKSEMRV
jgi:hypothetical protein